MAKRVILRDNPFGEVAVIDRGAVVNGSTKRDRRGIYVTHQGETKTLSQWARYFDIPVSTLYDRRRRGLKPPELFK